jgi:polar amino acid transport system ATP-binding protein
MLTARNIEKALGARKILTGIDLKVEPGKITVVVGPSGSGKTTLLRAACLLDPPDSGTVIVDDTEYSFPGTTETILNPPWPKVTAVFQQLFLWPHLTLRQNIELPIKYSGSPGRAASLLEEMVASFDMKEFIDRYPNQASLGQRQRVALARALVLEPKYLMLDEITSSLDVEQVASILAHLRLLRDRGVGLMVITHLLGFARSAGDEIVFLDEGKVIESGGRDILTNPTNKRVRAFLSLIQAVS